MTTTLPLNSDRQMSERELRIFEEWGSRPLQTNSSSSLGLNSQGHGQARAQAQSQRQNQPQTQTQNPRQNPGQAQDFKQNQGQPQGHGSTKVDNSLNGSVSANANPQRQKSQGQSQSYGTSNQNAGSVNRNVSASATFPRQMSQNLAHGQSQPQGHGMINANTSVNRSTSASVNSNINTSRQASHNQIQPQGQRRANDTYNANSNANTSSQTQKSQNTRGRRHGGRNKHRSRAPTVFDEWKAQATKEHEAEVDKNKRRIPIATAATVTANDTDRLKNVWGEWMAGAAGGEGGAGDTIPSVPADTAISRDKARTDAVATVSASVDSTSNQLDPSEDPKGRSGRNRKTSHGHKKSGVGPIEAVAKETEDVVAGDTTSAAIVNSAGTQQNSQAATDNTVPVASIEAAKGRSQTERGREGSHGHRSKSGSVSAGTRAHKEESISANSPANTPPVYAISLTMQHSERQPTVDQRAADVSLDPEGCILGRESNSKNSLSPEGSGSPKKLYALTKEDIAGSAYLADIPTSDISGTYAVPASEGPKNIVRPKNEADSRSYPSSESPPNGGLKLATIREDTMPPVSVEASSSVKHFNGQHAAGQASVRPASDPKKAERKLKPDGVGDMRQKSDTAPARSTSEGVARNKGQGTAASTSPSAGSSGTPDNPASGSAAATGSHSTPSNNRRGSRAHQGSRHALHGDNPKKTGTKDSDITVSTSATAEFPKPPVDPGTSLSEHQAVGARENGSASQQRSTPRNFCSLQGSFVPATPENASKATMNSKANTAVASAGLTASSKPHNSFTNQEKDRISMKDEPKGAMNSSEGRERKPSHSRQRSTESTSTGKCKVSIKTIFLGRTFILT